MPTQLIKNVLNVQPEQARLTPCLIAPTGAGKTSRVKALAETLNIPLEVLLPGTALPEDILGLPKIDKGTTKWSLPEFAKHAIDEPCLIFIDEMDKAHRDVHGALLTLLSGHEVRGHKLHKDTKIVCAMQPVDSAEWLSTETGRAMSARMVFFPIGYDWKRIENSFGLDMNYLPVCMPETLPVLSSPSTRQVEWACHYIDRFEATEETLGVLKGIFPKGIAEDMIERWKTRRMATLKPEAIVQTVNKNMDLINTLSLGEISNMAADIWEFGQLPTIEAAIYRVWTEGNEEDAAAYLKNGCEGLLARCNANGGEMDICCGATEEEVSEMLNRVIDRIGEVWEKRGKKQ